MLTLSLWYLSKKTLSLWWIIVPNCRKKPMTAATFSSDGSVLAVAAETVITLWDPKKNVLVAVIGETFSVIWIFLHSSLFYMNSYMQCLITDSLRPCLVGPALYFLSFINCSVLFSFDSLFTANCDPVLCWKVRVSSICVPRFKAATLCMEYVKIVSMLVIQASHWRFGNPRFFSCWEQFF